MTRLSSSDHYGGKQQPHAVFCRLWKAESPANEFQAKTQSATVPVLLGRVKPRPTKGTILYLLHSPLDVPQNSRVPERKKEGPPVNGQFSALERWQDSAWLNRERIVSRACKKELRDELKCRKHKQGARRL